MAEETEVTSGGQSDDFWNTYQEFFLNDDAVEVGDAEVTLDGTGLSSRHDTVSTSPQLRMVLSPADAEHEHTVEDPWSHSVVAADCYHTTAADEVGLHVHLDVNDTDHYHYADQTGLSDSSSLYAYSTEHAHVVDGDAALNETLSLNDATHILQDSGWVDIDLKDVTVLDMGDCSHFVESDEIRRLGSGADTVFPDNNGHVLASDRVGTFTFTDVLSYVAKGINLHTAEQVGTMPTVYMLDAADCEHSLLSDYVTPNYIHPESAVHGHVADSPWNWMNGAYHTVESPETALTVHLNPSDCEHGFDVEIPTLGLSVVPDDCVHYLFTPDTLDVSDCYHTVTSDSLEAHNLYRRLYV